jgi:glycosyltransferase involved in cell wall biosynthesis
MPTVSVIIPCYNQGRFIAEAIASLQGQSLTDWEALIIDDESTDETPEEANRLVKHDERVFYHRISNQGPSAARNVGLKVARGEFIQYLDADDKLELGKLEVHAKFLRRDPSVGIVYGNAAYFYEAEPGRLDHGPYARWPGDDWIASHWAHEGTVLEKMLRWNMLPVSAPLLRREVHERHGGWDEAFRTLEDWELWLRYAARGVVYQFLDLPSTRTLIRVHTASATNLTARMVAGRYKLSLKAMQYIQDDDQLLKNFVAGVESVRTLRPALPYWYLARLLLRVCAKSPRLAIRCARIGRWILASHP